MITLFNKACIYDKLNKKIKLFGHYEKPITNIKSNGRLDNCKVFFCQDRPDFLIEYTIDYYVHNNIYIDNLVFESNGNSVVYTNLKLTFPFENLNMRLDKDRSAIISTTCKNYSHRLDEWIQYNLKLGFSGIIIFNNDENKVNPINEPIENCNNNRMMKEITDKYEGHVLLIDFPYAPFKDFHYDNMQRNALSIGVNAMKDKCRNIALIDADEFIYIPKMDKMNIMEFLNRYNNTITIKSNIITNINDSDIIDNNIIELSEYVGEDKYTKTILFTKQINENEFITSPHIHPTEIILEKDIIIHYHSWINMRYQYEETMEKISCLKDFFLK